MCLAPTHNSIASSLSKIIDVAKEPDFYFSWKDRVAEKAASRAEDERKMASGEVSRAEMTRINGHGRLGCEYKGPSERMRKLAKDLE